jgi:ABC-type uncharacterized transport system ATPase subunit
VEKTCSRAIIIHEGRLMRDSKLESLIKEFDSVENAFSKTIGGK